MHIAVDGNEANIEKRVGIGEYAFQLLSSFYQTNNKHKFTVLLKNPPLPEMPKENDNWKYRVIGPNFLWTRFALPLHLFANSNFDLIFSPTHYGPSFSRIPSVISIMDLSFIRYPALFRKKDLVKLTRWTKTSVFKARNIITISQFSRQEIIDCYQTNPRKIFVTYPGYKNDIYRNDYPAEEVKKVKDKYGLDAYLLFVGTLQPRKNLHRLIAAFYNLMNRYQDLKLVIVGKKGWLYEDILNKINSQKLLGKVVYLDYLENQEVALLYNGAKAFVLPSLYEGFGFPVLEAMACGTPVVISNVSSLPEVAGKAGVIIDPNSVESIQLGIEKVIRDDQKYFRDELIKKGLEQAKNFSWRKCADQTLAILEETVK